MGRFLLVVEILVGVVVMLVTDVVAGVSFIESSKDGLSDEVDDMVKAANLAIWLVVELVQ